MAWWGFYGCMGLTRLLVGFWVLGLFYGGGVGRFGTSEPDYELMMVMGRLSNYSLPLIYAEKF